MPAAAHLWVCIGGGVFTTLVPSMEYSKQLIPIRSYPSTRLRIPTIQEEDNAGTKQKRTCAGLYYHRCVRLLRLGEPGQSPGATTTGNSVAEIGRVPGETEQPLRRRYSRITVSGYSGGCR